MQNDDKMKYILLAEADRRRFLREHAIYENNKSVEKSTKYGSGRKKGAYCYRKNQLKPEYQKQIEELKKQKEQNKENENKENENNENINKDNEHKMDEDDNVQKMEEEDKDDNYNDEDEEMEDEDEDNNKVKK